MGEVLTYKEELTKSMNMLGQVDNSIFIGQGVVHPDVTTLLSTLEGVPLSKRLELPVFEDTQMGMSIGLSLEGFLPISIYPRFDFLICAMNQLVNHLDKICDMSGYKPKVIIRTVIGSKEPLDAGIQHTQDYTQGLKAMLKNINVIRLDNKEVIYPSYLKALDDSRPTILIEWGDLYDV